MPTIFFVEGYRFYFFSDEGREPPHIHVRKGGMEAKVWLSPIELSSSSGMKSAQKKRILSIVRENKHEFIKAWRDHFSS